MSLKLDLSQRLRMEQTLRLAPQMIQAIEILQIPITELQDRINQELEINPVLEATERSSGGEDDGSGSGSSDGGEPGASGANGSASTTTSGEAGADAPAKSDDSGERMGFFDEQWNDDLDRPRVNRAAASEASDRKLEVMQNSPARSSTLQENLVAQIHMIDDLPSVVKDFAEFLIYNLDENGYLLFPIEEIARDYPAGCPSPEDIARTLALVQSLDPPGVGARDLRDCLLLQLDRRNADAHLERVIISHHLEDVENNRLPKIVKETGSTLEEVKTALESIRELNPRPGAAFNNDRVQYIVPDVVVTWVDGRYEIRLENAYIPRLSLSPTYVRQLSESKKGSEESDFLKRKVEQARWLIEAIHQRQSTLTRICNEVFSIQQDFLDKGPNYLHPLRMQEVADNVGVHISTVSRAISGKYAQTQRGIYPLRHFFTGAAKSTDGNVESQEGVKQKLLDIVAKEDKRYPLSDEDIVTKFKEAGIEIARRTVTKYRKALKIPSSRQRRQY